MDSAAQHPCAVASAPARATPSTAVIHSLPHWRRTDRSRFEGRVPSEEERWKHRALDPFPSCLRGLSPISVKAALGIPLTSIRQNRAIRFVPSLSVHCTDEFHSLLPSVRDDSREVGKEIRSRGI